jgi:hypothetical protein
MSINPELELLNEMFGLRDRREQIHLESLQKSTDAIDSFFEKRDFERSIRQSVAGAPLECGEPRAVSEFREFAKKEREKVPQMKMREIRSSAVQVLRKAADALAAI